MLPNELPVVINGSTSYFSLQSLTDGRSVRRDQGVTCLATPRTITVARSQSGKGNKAIESFLLRLDDVIATEKDANEFVQSTGTLSVYLVVKVPAGGLNSKSSANNYVTALRTLLNAVVSGSTQTVQNRWLGGEL